MMGWFSNLRVAPQLIGGFAVVGDPAGVVGAAGLTGISSLNGHVTSLTSDSLPQYHRAHPGPSADMEEAMRLTNETFVTSNNTLATQLAADATSIRAESLRDFAAYEALANDGSTDDQAAAQLRGLLNQWVTLDANAARLAAASQDQAAEKVIEGQERPIVTKISNTLDQIEATLQQEANSRVAAANSTYNAATMEMTIAVCAAMLLAIGLGIVIARSISGPLQR